MENLVHFCQGESHKATGKVCQDYAMCSCSSDKGIAVAVLSDGHGGSRYFRSDIGSKMIVECTFKKVMEFIENIDSSIFAGKPFTAVSALTTERKEGNLRKNNKVDEQLNQLFKSIIFGWRVAVEKHAEENPFTKEEQELISDLQDPHSIDKTYGCTLMCYVKTSKYWFAFHLGDGKCFSFDGDGNWGEPIPWDERCFLNKTTSICDTDALSEFRYCYQGNGDYPVAVFLASDGLDDSFGESFNQANFYIQILKLIVNTSNNDAQKEIEETLPQLSKIGSQDDMSVACIYDEKVLDSIIPKLILWQRDNVEKQITEVNEKILLAKDKMLKYSPLKSYTKKELIEAQYAQTDLERLFASKRELASKYNRFTNELPPTFSHAEYDDEIGLYEFKEEENRLTLTAEQIRKRLRVLNHPMYNFNR